MSDWGWKGAKQTQMFVFCNSGLIQTGSISCQMKQQYKMNLCTRAHNAQILFNTNKCSSFIFKSTTLSESLDCPVLGQLEHWWNRWILFPHVPRREMWERISQSSAISVCKVLFFLHHSISMLVQCTKAHNVSSKFLHSGFSQASAQSWWLHSYVSQTNKPRIFPFFMFTDMSSGMFLTVKAPVQMPLTLPGVLQHRCFNMYPKVFPGWLW